MGALSNIDEEGFPSAAFHSYPQNLRWDTYTGDYGPNFFGHAVTTGTYVVNHPDYGWQAFGGNVTTTRRLGRRCETLDSLRRRIYIAPLGLYLTLDRGHVRERRDQSDDAGGARDAVAGGAVHAERAAAHRAAGEGDWRRHVRHDTDISAGTRSRRGASGVVDDDRRIDGKVASCQPVVNSWTPRCRQARRRSSESLHRRSSSGPHVPRSRSRTAKATCCARHRPASTSWPPGFPASPASKYRRRVRTCGTATPSSPTSANRVVGTSGRCPWAAVSRLAARCSNPARAKHRFGRPSAPAKSWARASCWFPVSARRVRRWTTNRRTDRWCSC